jgi:murein DD-endopeptidase MepM/ murein hydrolase activator NlpD
MGRVVRFPLLVVSAVLAIAIVEGCATARRADQTDDVPSGWPVAPTTAFISSGFGAPRSGAHHQGVDLSAPAGTPVRATADGTVTMAERAGGYGRTVVLDHGSGWQTRYAHLKRIKVDRGWRIRRGDVLGTVGRSGNATGAHLHYEVLRNGTPVDPRPFLDRP